MVSTEEDVWSCGVFRVCRRNLKTCSRMQMANIKIGERFGFGYVYHLFLDTRGSRLMSKCETRTHPINSWWQSTRTLHLRADVRFTDFSRKEGHTCDIPTYVDWLIFHTFSFLRSGTSMMLPLPFDFVDVKHGFAFLHHGVVQKWRCKCFSVSQSLPLAAWFVDGGGWSWILDPRHFRIGELQLFFNGITNHHPFCRPTKFTTRVFINTQLNLKHPYKNAIHWHFSSPPKLFSFIKPKDFRNIKI